MIAATPSMPNMLKVCKVCRDSATLSWSAPHRDGGAPITRYVIRRRLLPAGQWDDVGSVGAHTTSYTAINLREGRPHLFAVYAVNRAGNGDVMETSHAVTPKRVTREWCPREHGGGVGLGSPRAGAGGVLGKVGRPMGVAVSLELLMPCIEQVHPV